MLAGYITHIPEDPQPYRVILQRDGETIRVQPVRTTHEANRTLSELIRIERAYDRELRWYEEPESFVLDA